MKYFTLHSEDPQFEENKICNDKLLLGWMLGLIVFRLWLVEVYELKATWTPHDDYLFVSLAKHLLSGEWLGPYNGVTLIKGPVYPLFIAASHLAGLPLFFSQQLLYSLACAIAISALRPLCGNRLLLMACFALLLLNPFMYNYPVVPGRVLREGFSISLVLIVFATLLGSISRLGSTLKRALYWSVGFGIAFTLLWHTREEGIWLLPSVALSTGMVLFVDRKKPAVAIARRILIVFVPAAIFCAFSLYLAFLNQKHYGRFVINELKTKEFISAYGGLINIKPQQFKRFVPVNGNAMERAFAASPSFAELQPYFQDRMHHAQLHPSFFIWTLRSVAGKAGHSKDLTASLDFYGRVGDELRQACHDGRLDCLDRDPSLQPPWNSSYNPLIAPVFVDIFKQAVGFVNFNTSLEQFAKFQSFGSKKVMSDYRFVTLEPLLTSNRRTVAEYPDFYQHLRIEKVRLLNDIGDSYKFLVPLLFAIAILLHLIVLFRDFKSGQCSTELVFGAVLLGGLISLVAVLTFVNITLWPIGRPLYSAYPVILLYICYMPVGLFKYSKHRQCNPSD